MITALDKLDPQSSPGLDGVRALLDQPFPEQFCTRMLPHVAAMRRKGTFQESLSQGITRSLPKEPRSLGVERQRPHQCS